MPTLLDEICPDYVGEARFKLTLGAGTPDPAAFGAVDVDVDYSDADPAGVVLPLELTILAPTATNFVRKIYTRSKPSTITFQPREGGRYSVRLAEVGHNRWFGFLQINVAGDSASAETVT